MLVGTMAAYVAYGYLIRHTSPIIASSCMYVNPVVAVALGALLLGEPVTSSTVIATIVILSSVGLSFWFDYRQVGSGVEAEARKAAPPSLLQRRRHSAPSRIARLASSSVATFAPPIT